MQGTYWFVTEQRRDRGAVNRRLLLAKQTGSAQEVFETLKRERGLIGLENKRLSRLNDLILQTGLRLDQKLLIVVAFLLGLLFFVLLGLAFGYGLLSFIFSVNIRRGCNGDFPCIRPKKTHCEIFRAAA